MLERFRMVDGMDFDAPKRVRLSEIDEAELTRGFGGSPKYQHRPGATWRLVATPRQSNDDLSYDRVPERAWDFMVGEVLADTTHEPPELVQIISLSYVGA
jgi:hypothetical protein